MVHPVHPLHPKCLAGRYVKWNMEFEEVRVSPSTAELVDYKLIKKNDKKKWKKEVENKRCGAALQGIFSSTFYSFYQHNNRA